MELISREAAIRFIRDNIALSTFMKRNVSSADKACMELCERIEDELPTIDAVPIVRCRDCEYYQREWDGDRKDTHFCSENDRWTEDNDFCSEGERRQS